ncbi:protein mono-ADP-ribosyltransferase PARP14-like [Saccostrea echinata]|uniref:protein mono-ADP-ribosyltransferase PARP14-like n=1 Tax=Saccostrea echinata TaxID=191078 RepID=UPI002A81E5BD|nr:protein mono-ADP-ribosyltransferase PARP14-like [Saccostrea echinata]
MSGTVWKQTLCPRCVYVYSDGLETFETDHTDVEGSCAAVCIPDPADQRGGRRLLLLFKDENYVQNCLGRKCITYKGSELRVEHCNNACDIPDEWEKFVEAPFQTRMQYPSTESGPQQNETYTNMPSRQDVHHLSMPDPQMYQNLSGQQMPFPPGQQIPVNPAQYPYMYPYPYPGFVFPQEGATAQEKPVEGGNFHFTPQMWLQQMQMLQMYENMKAGGAGAPPPYSVTEEETESGGGSLPINRSQGSVSETQVTPHSTEQQYREREASTEYDPDQEDDGNPEKEDINTEVAMIKVTSIPPGTSEDSLLFFFENRRKSGGGSITDIEYDPDTQSAVITFEESAAVKRVLGKMPILFSGVQIGVEEFRPNLEVDSPVEEQIVESENVLEVRGVSERTTTDTVEMYFENTRRSGGGDIKNMEEKEGVFYIVFEDESVIENVLRKRHKIDGTAIQVCRYVPPPPPKPVPMYPNKVFIKNISEKTTKDGLENFLEAKTSITPTSIEYGEIEGAALVTFEEDLDFEKLQLACKKRSLDKSYLEVSRVPITNCVIVRNISEKTSRDTLEFYFDNERRSGVTGVLDVKLLDGFCLVYFEEPEAVDVVCSRQHKVDGQDLDVKIYYECLGQVESDEEGPFQPPRPLELTDLDTKKLQFLIKSPSNQQAIEKQLEAVYGKPVWPKKSKSVSLTVECTLTAETKDCKKLAKTWEAKVKENLNKFLGLLLVTKHSTLQEAFPLVLNELKSLTISNPDAVAVVLEKSNHEIYVTGHIQASQEVSKQVSDIIQKVEQELDRKKQQVQEEKKIKRFQVLILQFCKFEQNLQKKYEGISLKYDMGKNCVYFEGLSGDVTPAIVDMYEFLDKVVKTEVKPFSRFLRSFLVTQPVCKYVNSKMKENDLVGVWESSDGDETLTVYSLSDQQAVKAAHLLKESVIETPVDVKVESRPLLSQEEWRSRSTEIEKEGEGLIKIVTQIDQNKIIILCTDKWEGVGREYVEDFMMKNTIYEETLQLDSGMMRYIQMNCAQDIDKIDKDIQMEKGNVKISNIGIIIKGTKTGLNKAKYAVDQIVQSVKKHVHSIKKPGIRKHLQSSQGQDKIRSVEKSQGVVIDVSDESVSDEDTDSTVLRTGVPRQELAVCVTPLGKKISAMVVDMLELEVDVIVNPANKDMRHIGGVAKIIVEKGGRSIQEECNDYVRKKGRLMEGQVFFSSAGNLKCKGVVHAVGPVWQNGTNQEEEYLREAVFKSLEVTSENGFTSIAFPALCTGVFGYPMREATRVIVVAVKDFFSGNSGSPVEAVYLCDVSAGTVEGFVRAMKKELKDVKVKSSESRSSGSSSKWKTSSGPVPAERKSFKPSPVEAGNITVRVITGQIAKQKVDVIVNTTSKDLKLGNGAVSASLLKAAGSSIQQECDQNYPRGIQHGDIAVTSGGNLSCQFICHGSLPGWDQQGQALKILRTFLEKCLNHVDSNRLSSVAFPAMGTGNLGYPRDTVAKEMFDAVHNFGSNNPSTTISDVRFVLYDKDTETVKAFEKEEKRQGGGSGRHGRQFSSSSQYQSPSKFSGGGGSSETGRNGNNSPSELSDSEEFALDIGNLQLKVYQGDITKANVDAIVNSTNSEFDLSRGIVSKLLLKLGGDDLKKQIAMNKKSLTENGIAVTTSGIRSGLSCNFILHLDAERTKESWEHKILKTIETADEIQGCKSIAFPTLGQAFGVKAENLAKYFFEALKEGQEKATNLKEVHIVIFESKLIRTFLESFKTCCENYRPKEGGFLKKMTKMFGFGKQESNMWEGARKTQRMPLDMSSVTLVIYADSQQKIDQAIDMVERGVDSFITKRIFAESVVKEFTPQQESEIQQLKDKFDVDVTVEKRVGRIILQGLTSDIMEASEKVHKLLRQADAVRQEKQAAEMMASMVEWCFIEITSAGQKLEPYPPEINMQLEKALRKQESEISFKDAQGVKYIVDLAAYEEYPESDPTDIVKVIRKNKISGSNFEQPVTWTAMGDKENVAVVTLQPSSKEYKDVVQDFQSQAGALTIIKVERIQNRMLLQQYDAKLKLMDKQNPSGKNNERVLWHGTASDSVASINTYGFNRSYCGKNATAYGNGVYFAVNASYSASSTYSPPDISGNRRVYRSRVLTGEYCPGRGGMKVPPNKPGGGHILYDSVVDNTSNPGIFVIFNDTQAYPEYLITFQ